jgi:hypothetical protein
MLEERFFLLYMLNVLPSIPRLHNNYKSVFYGATIYIIRIIQYEDGTIKLAKSKPCKHCLELISRVGIKKVIYSVDEGVIVTRTKDIVKPYISTGYESLSSGIWT